MSILNKIDFKNLSTKHLKEIISKSNYRKEKKALLTAVLNQPVHCQLDKEYIYRKYSLDRDLYELRIVLCLHNGWSRIYNNIHPSLSSDLSILSRTIGKIETYVGEDFYFPAATRFIFYKDISNVLNQMLTMLWHTGPMKFREQIIEYFNIKPRDLKDLDFKNTPMKFIKINQIHFKKELIKEIKEIRLREFYRAPDCIKCDQEVLNAWLSTKPTGYYYGIEKYCPRNINELSGLVGALLFGVKCGNKKSRKSFEKEIFSHKKAIEKIQQLFSLPSNKNWLGTFFKRMRYKRVRHCTKVPYVYTRLESDIFELFYRYFEQDIIIYEILDCAFFHEIPNPDVHCSSLMDEFSNYEDILCSLKDFDNLNLNALKFIFLYHSSNYESSNPFLAVRIQKLIEAKEKRQSIEMNKYNRSVSNILFARNNHMKFNKTHIME